MGTYQQGQPILISDTFTVGGAPTDPTGVVYTILGPDGVTDTYTWPGDPEVTNPAVGSFELSLAPPALPGEYHYDVDASGAVVASRAASFTVLPNIASATAVTWAVPGPCTAWCDSQDVWDCCGQPMTTVGEGSLATECPVDMSQYAMEASQLLWELSGRLHSGTCERTVRPCANDVCSFQVLSRGHVVTDPYHWGGAHWHRGSYVGCGCSPLDTILLSGYPVREIAEVLIDGVAVSADTYRLDERRLLRRVRDPADPDTVLYWPSCQAMDLPDTEAGTFSVTYRYGQDPPVLGIHAAAQLACELYRACSGGDCALPSGTTRITRQGVTINKMAALAWLHGRDGWRTGLPLVDAFLSGYARSGLPRRPSLWSPSGPRYARSVGQ